MLSAHAKANVTTYSRKRHVLPWQLGREMRCCKAVGPMVTYLAAQHIHGWGAEKGGHKQIGRAAVDCAGFLANRWAI